MAVEGATELAQALMSKPSSLNSPDTITPTSPTIDEAMRLPSYRVNAPFSDFAGRCFLRGCLCADLLQTWVRKQQAQADTKVKSAETWRCYLHGMGWLGSWRGVASCTALAVCLIPVFAGNTHRAIVPLF